MSETDYETIGIRLTNGAGEWRVPPVLVQKLDADAKQKETNRNAVILRILSDLYKVPVEIVDRKTEPSSAVRQINVRLPYALSYVIGRAGAARRPKKRSIQNEIISALCTHYGVPLVVPARRTRKRRVAAA